MSTWQERLNSILRSWEGTKWSAGQCCKGRGVDCRFFIMGVMDELYQIQLPLPPRLPQDTGTNNRPLALATVSQITRRYPCRPYKDEPIEAGDVLIVRRPGSAVDAMPHVMIAGIGSPLPIWHAAPGSGVCFTALEGWIVAHSYRPLQKELWEIP